MSFLAVLLAVLATSGGLTVRTGGLESAEGLVVCAVYDSADSFLGDRTVRGTRLPAEGSEAAWTIGELPPGDYAVSCYHDRNANGKLDRNAVGIPTEPYGFSNDARGSFGPPRFRKVRFRYDGGAATVVIPLR